MNQEQNINISSIPSQNNYNKLLWTFLILFCIRVLAQLVQLFFNVSFIPPFESFHSGTLDYSILLSFQVIIIALLLRVSILVSKNKLKPNKRRGNIFIHLGVLYALVMVLRYIFRMSIYPEERWISGCIPIFFHIILAAFVYVNGLYHKNHSEAKEKKGVGLTFKILAIPLYLIVVLFIVYQILPSLVSNELNWRASQYFVEEQKKVSIGIGEEILIANVYLPKKSSPSPTILVRIPLDDNFKGSFLSNILGRLWGSRGYNVVIQGVRGRYGSTGKHIPFQMEREDGIKTLEWINKQDWSNGKIGMWGGSYFGYTQWVLSDQKELGFSAMFTQISSSENYEMFYEGGVLSLESALFWAARSHSNIDTPQSYEQLKNGYSAKNIIDADSRSIVDIPFFNNWVNHNKKDEYWNYVDGIDRSKKLEVPIHMMAGWYDPYLSSQIEDFNQIQNFAKKDIVEASRLVIGPWSHAETEQMPNGYKDQNYRLASIQTSLDWYDHHLLNLKSDQKDKVKIFVMGINEWRSEKEFPLQRTKYKKMYLGGTNALSFDTTDLKVDSLSYHYDPLNPVPSIGGRVLGSRAGPQNQSSLYTRDDVFLFASEVMESNLEVTGDIQLKLWVSTSSKNSDFTAKLLDIYPDGRHINISEGILRKDYLPESKQEITISLNATSNVFLKGHKIGLEISSSNHPRYARNSIASNQKVYFGSEMKSYIILPIIEN